MNVPPYLPQTNDSQLVGEPSFSYQHFQDSSDRATDWRVANVPWRLVRLAKLYSREEFTPGSSYGRNAWGELYKGESVQRFYARIPAELVASYNLVLDFEGRRMALLKDAAADFVKPRKMTEPELMGYFRWMGVA